MGKQPTQRPHLTRRLFGGAQEGCPLRDGQIFPVSPRIIQSECHTVSCRYTASLCSMGRPMLRTTPPSARRLALCNGPDVTLGEGCKTADTRIRAATSGGLSSLASAVCGGSTLPDTPRHGTHAVRRAHHRAGVVQATAEV